MVVVLAAALVVLAAALVVVLVVVVLVVVLVVVVLVAARMMVVVGVVVVLGMPRPDVLKGVLLGLVAVGTGAASHGEYSIAPQRMKIQVPYYVCHQ